MEIEERIQKIICEQLGVKPEQAIPEAHFTDDLGMDSLESVELVMALEDEFGFEIPDEDAERMHKVKDAISYVQKRLEQKH